MSSVESIELAEPEYVSTSVGAPDLGNIANRLRDLAIVLASHNLEHEAEYLSMAFGRLRARIARQAADAVMGAAQLAG